MVINVLNVRDLNISYLRYSLYICMCSYVHLLWTCYYMYVYGHVIFLSYVVVMQLYQGYSPAQCHHKPKSHRAPFYDTGL